MVRTRATASAAPAAPLSAAPRRRLKLTPLEKEEVKKPTKPIEEEAKSTTRATRGKKAVVEPEHASNAKHKATTTTVSRSRGRPKKADTAIEDAEPEMEKPKRATRSTRATATTASSVAKEKPAARTTRTTKTTAKEQPVETAPPAKPVPKKKVTFEDIIVDDKENHPCTTRAASKSTKSTDKGTGLRAKPVRKPITATRSSKRTNDQALDDEEEKPRKKIQRVLTPKKITQIARAATPEEASDDELNRGKTPVRDLSLSPRRPQTTITAEAIARTLSPAKKLDFTQSLLHQSTKKDTEDAVGALMSPARRPPTSPAKLFSQPDLQSPVRVLSNENSNALASPARRPMDSPAKLLFPNTTKHDQRLHRSKTASNLFQSPKRSLAFDPASIFSLSAVKPPKRDASKSNFLSSPAKRTALFSPMKTSTTPQSTMNSAQTSSHSSDELDVNGMEVTELIENIAEEITVSSHQRASVFPMRTYKLSADELHMDFDDSILPVGSPLKLAKSPSKPAVQSEPIPVMGYDADATELDQEMEESMPSMQSTPRTISYHDSSSINPRVLETEDDPTLRDLSEDQTMTDEGDDTIVLPENINAATPRSVAVSYRDNDESIDELAPSPREDVVTEFMRTPGTPAMVHEHELTNMMSSPEANIQMPVASLTEQFVSEVQSPASLVEDELTMMGGTPKAATTLEAESHIEQESLASLHDNELTIMADAFAPRSVAAATPASITEHELTMMGRTPKSAITPRAASIMEEDSPANLAEHELTFMADAFTPRPIVPEAMLLETEDYPASLAEDELTVMADAFTPKPARVQSPLDNAAETRTPASVAEHELTIMGDAFTPNPGHIQTPVPSALQPSREAQTPATVAEHELRMMAQTSPGRDEIQDDERTPVPAAAAPATFTPDMPIPRKFHMHTVISKVPLKPEAEDSPAKLQIKKRKRPHSLGAQPEFVDISDRATPAKAARTASSPQATSGRATLVATPVSSALQRTPASKMSSAKSSRRVVSTPAPRTPLTEFANSDVLAGVVVYVDVRTSEGADASAIYVDLLNALGAKVVKEWKDNLTHIVYKDGSPKVLEKARLSESDVKVVGVSWPLDCEAQKTWVGESDYLLNLTPTDQVLQSVTKSARRKSMEPSMLIADGSGSVKRSRSKNLRRSSIKPPADSTLQGSLDNDESVATITTPTADPAKKAADLEKNSLTAAWKSINATHNLGEDTPARRTLELLRKSYEVESGWDDSLLSSNDDDENQNQENTPRPYAEASPDPEILETGLTPAPYKVQNHIGSAPPKATNNGMMSYRERVEEMERREMRDNAFGTNKGGRGVGGKKGGNGKRMTMFGFEPVRQSPLGR
ncbi:hypothetical protein LTR70_009257 [Exophiala xenobiotica]|uniref:BRCT domain-containing protein n=1 Tax=Lithohypha guttulata TaxID=1690604 RepID=A0ABR0JY88_9EURO|nr:hypothetical protein LTR24_009083 [Lithohypha guttulata]KAK5310722.1 hypothetical protein LTR70_009257 [Exophiala xenobiotica]